MANPFFLRSGGGQIRYWREGEGADVLVLGGLALPGAVRAAEVHARLPGWRVTALDLPGFGTEAAPGNLGTLVGQLREAIVVLGLESCPIVAIDLAVPLAAKLAEAAGSPPSALVALGVGDARSWAARRLAPPQPVLRGDGTHLTQLWAFLRDLSFLDASTSRRVAAAGGELPSPEDLNLAILAAGTRPDRYSELWNVCIEAFRSLHAPAPFREVDSLDALAVELRPAVRAADAQPAATTANWPADRISLDYVDTPEGRVHIRRMGRGRPLIVLQSAPGSAEPFEGVMLGLAGKRTVVAPDFIGNGDSDKPAGAIDIAYLARNALHVADALGFDELDVWGSHTGALVALEMMLIAPDRVGRGVLESPILLDPAETADIMDNYFRDLSPDPWGLHLQAAWNLRRDIFLFWPWYKQDRAHVRSLGIPDVPTLHDWAIGLLKSGRSYPASYRAGFSYDTRRRLPLVRQPTLICAGPADMLAKGLDLARELLPRATVRATPATVWYPGQEEGPIRETLRIYDEFLE